MRVVYNAENIIDAHLVKNLLEQAGIVAFVFGEHLVGGVGELPVMELVSVSVADADEADADVALREWREARPVPFDERDFDALPHPAS